MLLIDGVRYELWTPGLEREEFEPIVQEHASDIFGRQSVYVDIKKRLESDLGTKAVPDAFVIHYGQAPHWRIIEVELSKHPLHEHIVAQVGKFISGIGSPSTQKRIADALDSEIRKQDVNLLRLRRAIEPTEVYRFLSNLVAKPPILTIVIEEETPQLKEALNILSYPRIEVVGLRTYTREGIGLGVHAHVFEPLFSPVSPPSDPPPPNVTPKNELYRRFFGELIARYRRKDPSLPAIKPQPWSLIGFGAGKGSLWFQWAFRANKQFSVELYIATVDKVKNKEYFDRLRDSESQLGIGDLCWERLDDKKASRIAVYTAGEIQQAMNDSAEKERLIGWGVERMKDFTDKLGPIIKTL